MELRYTDKAGIFAFLTIVAFIIFANFISTNGMDDALYLMLMIVTALLVFLTVSFFGFRKEIQAYMYREDDEEEKAEASEENEQ